MKKIRILALLCTGMIIFSACGKSGSDVTQPAGSVEDEISVQEQDESEDDLQQNSDNSVEDKYLALVYDSYAYGYIDENGEEVIECQYDYAKNFSHNGLAPVRDENDLWGYIDTEGNQIIDCIYEEAGTFTDNGLALVESKEDINDEGQRTYRYGFIDENGDTVVAFEYADASDYKNGYARVERDGLWGFVDESGEEIIPCQYSQAGDFAPNGLAPVRNADGLYGYINKNNEVIIDFQFLAAGSFGNNTDLAPVANQDGLIGYINSSGEVSIDFIYSRATAFDDLGCAMVILPEDMVQNGPIFMGYINSDGAAITDNDLRDGYEFSENGLARVARGEYGYINTDGEYVIPLEYDYATDFGDNGWAAVGWDGGSWEHENSRLFYINQDEVEMLACDQYEEAYEFVKVPADDKVEINDDNSKEEKSVEYGHLKIDSNTVEDYSENLDPNQYILYSCSEFDFYYPPNLYRYGDIITENEYDGEAGILICGVDLNGGNSSEVYIEVNERDDDYTNEEFMQLLYEDFIIGYNDINQISYSEENDSFYFIGYMGEKKWCDHVFVKLEKDKVYILYITYLVTDNMSNEDLQERLYVAENIYRMCSFTDSEEDPRTYKQFLSDQL